MYTAFVLVLMVTYVFKVPVSSLIDACKPELSFSLRLYPSFLLENRKRLEALDIFRAFPPVAFFSDFGFTWRVLYSVALIGIGYYGFVRKTEIRKQGKNVKSGLSSGTFQILPDYNIW